MKNTEVKSGAEWKGRVGVPPLPHADVGWAERGC